METKFKVGDKVRVKSLEWYNKQNKDANGDIDISSGCSFLEEMSKYCGSVLEIKGIETYHCSYTVYNNIWSWQDWMLEDEAVTEVKQEVEQSNKNDMETKEMTKEEVFKFLKDTKILCTSTEETAEVQEKLFELGIQWMYDGRNVLEDKYLLFINSKGCINYCSDINTWMEDINKRIEPSEILAIQLKEEKPKFDPTSLKPFDKVLVRYSKKDDWKCSLFSHLNKNEDVICVNVCVYGCWDFCIPYNDETKHLVGTTEDEPEFYQVWKK